jgi:hypothetical protein
MLSDFLVYIQRYRQTAARLEAASVGDPAHASYKSTRLPEDSLNSVNGRCGATKLQPGTDWTIACGACRRYRRGNLGFIGPAPRVQNWCPATHNRFSAAGADQPTAGRHGSHEGHSRDLRAFGVRSKLCMVRTSLNCD